MTRKEAIEVLKDLWRYEHSEFSEKDIREALDIAINSLEIDERYELEYEQIEPCEDAISRQAVLDIIKFEYDWLLDAKGHNADTKIAFSGIKSKVLALPPVNPQEPKTGHWIAYDIYNCHTDFKCSECGYIYSFVHLYGEPTADYSYCPNCGVRMIESEE